jgi:hypothetical protein
MTINKQIRDAVHTSNNTHTLCNKLFDMSDPDNDKCPAKDLLLSIRHYTLISNENVDKIDFLYNKLGDVKVINPNLKESLLNEEHTIISLPIF